jgi:ParB family chromosome partitioning protein
MQSIKDYGVIQPLSVRLITPSNYYPPSYELIAGERRLRAVKLLSWETVPCVVVNADRKISAEIAIIENLQREDLNFFEQAMAIQKLIELFGYTQEQAARRLSVSQSYIANKLRILKLSEAERDVITEYKLTERHARSFIRVAGEEERGQIISTVIKRSMNVSSTEKYIDKILSGVKQEEEEEAARQSPRRSFIVKDVRLFLNTIDKVVDTIAQSGINIKSEKTDKGEYIEIYLSVPKKKA